VALLFNPANARTLAIREGEPDGTIEGDVVLLTGGSRGIGPVVAEALAKRGANIALAARSENGLRDVARHLTELGTETLVAPIDLRESSQRENLWLMSISNLEKSTYWSTMRALESEGAYAELSWPSIQEDD